MLPGKEKYADSRHSWNRSFIIIIIIIIIVIADTGGRAL
jgi:hypothetical protein